jgi:hypothetical protein
MDTKSRWLLLAIPFHSRTILLLALANLRMGEKKSFIFLLLVSVNCDVFANVVLSNYLFM